MNNNRCTMKDVADDAGVSTMTVSRVLNHDEKVSPETRDRILASIEKLNYRRNMSASSLASAQSYVIGFLYDDPRSGYMNDIIISLLGESNHLGYHVIAEEWSEGALDNILRQHNLDGVILPAPLSEFEDLLAELKSADIPFVRLAAGFDIADTNRVQIDDYLAARDMTNYLIELGHRNIGFIKGHPNQGSSERRYAGYCDALKTNNIRLDKRKNALQGYFTFDSGMTAADKLLDRQPDLTAIFASNDDMALGAMAAASRRGLQVPKDLSVAGFDDTSLATRVWPPLTTVRQPILDMAKTAVSLLIKATKDRKKGRITDYYSKTLPHELVKRGSVAPLQ